MRSTFIEEEAMDDNNSQPSDSCGSEESSGDISNLVASDSQVEREHEAAQHYEESNVTGEVIEDGTCEMVQEVGGEEPQGPEPLTSSGRR